jgi:hypothetical protein
MEAILDIPLTSDFGPHPSPDQQQDLGNRFFPPIKRAVQAGSPGHPVCPGGEKLMDGGRTMDLGERPLPVPDMPAGNAMAAFFGHDRRIAWCRAHDIHRTR